MVQANKFLEILTGNKNITFQTFADNESSNCSPKILHGTLEQHANKLQTLNKSGSGVYLMVNEGDLKGRSKKNVIRVRALFADFDGVQLPEKWPLEPSIIVESSQGKYHAYWLLTDDLPLDDFKPLQQAIAKRFGSDNKVCDLPRVMRVAGFYHQKGSPFLSTLIKYSDLNYLASDLKEVFPIEKPRVASKPRPNVQFNNDVIGKYVTKAVENQCSEVANASKGDRNHALNKSAYSLGRLVGSGALDGSQAENALTNAALSCGLSETEIRITISSGLRAGIDHPFYPDLSTKQSKISPHSPEVKPLKSQFVSYRDKRKSRRRERLNSIKGLGGENDLRSS